MGKLQHRVDASRRPNSTGTSHPLCWSPSAIKSDCYSEKSANRLPLIHQTSTTSGKKFHHVPSQFDFFALLTPIVQREPEANWRIFIAKSNLSEYTNRLASNIGPYGTKICGFDQWLECRPEHPAGNSSDDRLRAKCSFGDIF